MAPDVDHFNGQREHFRHHLSDSRGRTLADVRSSGMYRYAAVHVNLNVHGGVWEIFRVPVDG